MVYTVIYIQWVGRVYTKLVYSDIYTIVYRVGRVYTYLSG